MNVLIQCAKCRKKVSVAMRSLGKKVRCPHCRGVFEVERGAAQEMTEAATSAPEVEGGAEPEPKEKLDYMRRSYTFAPMTEDSEDSQEQEAERAPRRPMPLPVERGGVGSLVTWLIVLAALVGLVYLIRNGQFLVHYFADPHKVAWREMTFSDLNFQVDAPGPLARQPQNDPNNKTIHDYEVRFPRQNLFFSVHVRDLTPTPPEDFVEEEALLKAADKLVRDDWDAQVVKRKWGKRIVPEQVVTRVGYGEHFGMDYRYFMPEDKVRVFRRFFVVRGRMYLLGAEIMEDQYWALADRFLKSFRLVNAPPGPRLKSNERKGALPPSVVQTPAVTPALALRGHQRPISLLAFSEDGTRLLTGARYDFLLKWDIVSTIGSAVASTEHFPYFTVDPGTASAALQRALPAPNHLLALKVDPRDPRHELTFPQMLPDHLMTGSLPNLEVVRLTRTPIAQIDFTGDGRRFVAPLANELALWNVLGLDDKPELIWRQPTQHVGISSVAVSRDGKRAATGGHFDGDITLWDLASRQPIKKFSAHKIGSLKYVPVEPRPEDKEAKDTKELKESKETKAPVRFKQKIDVAKLGWNAPGVRALAFTHDGQLVSAGTDNAVHLWKADGASDTVKSLRKFDVPAVVVCMEISPSGKWLALGIADGTVQLIDLDTTTLRSKFRIAETMGPVTALRFNADERTLAVACEICEGAYATYLLEVARLPPLR